MVVAKIMKLKNFFFQNLILKNAQIWGMTQIYRNKISIFFSDRHTVKLEIDNQPIESQKQFDTIEWLIQLKKNDTSIDIFWLPMVLPLLYDCEYIVLLLTAQ